MSCGTERALVVITLAAALAAPGVGWAQGRDEPESSPCPGIIFNIDTPLNGLESYQGGVGAKLSFYPSALRALAAVQYAGASGSFSVNLGAVYEYHFLRPPVSPYVGVSLAGGYLLQQPTAAIIPLSAGVLFGAEVYVLSWLSLFAEYGISVEVNETTDLQSQAVSWDTALGAGMGNGGMIGVVVYFPPPRKD